jgi:hypothetical protein
LGWARQFGGLSTESLMFLPYWQHWHSGKRYVDVITGIAVLQNGSLVWTDLGEAESQSLINGSNFGQRQRWSLMTVLYLSVHIFGFLCVRCADFNLC